MVIHVLLQRATLDLIWARSDPRLPYNAQAFPVGESHALVPLDHEVLTVLSQRDPNAATLDDAVRSLLGV